MHACSSMHAMIVHDQLWPTVLSPSTCDTPAPLLAAAEQALPLELHPSTCRQPKTPPLQSPHWQLQLLHHQHHPKLLAIICNHHKKCGRMHACTDTHARTDTHAHAHTDTHAHAHTRARTHTHIHINSWSYINNIFTVLTSFLNPYRSSKQNSSSRIVARDT